MILTFLLPKNEPEQLFIKCGKIYEEYPLGRVEIVFEVASIFTKKNNMTVESRVKQTYAILLFFTVKVTFSTCIIYFINKASI